MAYVELVWCAPNARHALLNTNAVKLRHDMAAAERQNTSYTQI